VDLSCDYAPSRKSKGMLAAHKPTDVSPHMHTSNIATITPSIGGVGYNVALAAELASNLVIKLCSFVADDL
jgi:pseudouridine-5'-phosphate glycosidase/pseudouridine kinase